ncbi:hypothetical protein GCM10027429_01400 [Marivirga atlantica]|jgi:hypothetical protein|uniref:DUF1801 domain-containing protein n=1 Tax=Marivirga atlantica TaxID=1548457 RepID=A0A937AJB5_9BACT|nr:DUF1801 domain-containing protein [Marivirga atlantica]MBL0763752.1 DUF1801 domain-containing protein [Marivirga atlantica]
MNLEDTLTERPKLIQEVAILLKKIIQKNFPDLEEHVYGNKIFTVLYSKENPTQVVCGIQTSEKHCLLFLHKTGEVDTNGLTLEGKGKSAKHVKFRLPKEIDEKVLTCVLSQIYDKV